MSPRHEFVWKITTLSKFISIKTSLSECYENLNNIDEGIFDLVELKNVENETLECIRFFEPFHDILVEIFCCKKSLILLQFR